MAQENSLEALSCMPTTPTNIMSSGHADVIVIDDDDDDDTNDDLRDSSDDDSDYKNDLNTDLNDKNDHSMVPSLTESRSTKQMQTQNDSPLFRLPPELRNKIYKYTFEGGNSQCSDKDHEHARLDLLAAVRNAPSDALLWACRRINFEGRGIFLNAQRDFWSSATFTLTFVERNPLDTDSHHFTLLENLRNEQISDIPKISIDVIRDKATTLKLLLTPCIFRGIQSWKPSREETDDSNYSDLDIVRHFLPAQQYCHGPCRPFLAYQQVAAAVYQELWHGAAGDHLDRGRCVVCGGYVDCRMSGNRRSDLLALVAWMCAMFEVTLRLASS